MLRDAVERSEGLVIQVMLTAEQVANEMLQAMREGKRDLTLAPNPDAALLIELTRNDPDRAEDAAGLALARRLQS
ncbi:MAG TPA: hypothetical protein VF040_15565, partial [Ktedonobacterales bacterium]